MTMSAAERSKMVGASLSSSRFFRALSIAENDHWRVCRTNRRSPNVAGVRVVVAGAFLGRWVLGRLNQRVFEALMIGFAALGAVRMSVREEHRTRARRTLGLIHQGEGVVPGDVVTEQTA